MDRQLHRRIDHVGVASRVAVDRALVEQGHLVRRVHRLGENTPEGAGGGNRLGRQTADGLVEASERFVDRDHS